MGFGLSIELTITIKYALNLIKEKMSFYLKALGLEQAGKLNPDSISTPLYKEIFNMSTMKTAML
jgi:hypothetical protein